MMITEGRITILGQTIGRTDIRALHRCIGLVNPTTDSGAYHVSDAVVDSDLSAHQAVATGFFATVGLYDTPTPQQHCHVDALLDEVALTHRRYLHFSLLSSGEQRRCLIARALVHLPRLLILDEPTAGMNVSGREHVLATIESILDMDDPPTVLMITHHVEELSPRTSQVLLMRQGQITAAGSPDQVITPESLTQTFDCKVFVKRQDGRFWLQVLPEAWLDMLR